MNNSRWPFSDAHTHTHTRIFHFSAAGNEHPAGYGSVACGLSAKEPVFCINNSSEGADSIFSRRS